MVKDKKQRIEKALKEACNKKEQFLQESTPQREQLNIEKKQVEELYFEAERLYQSKGEDSEARHKRMQEANKKLLELQEIVNDFANKDRNSPERVRAYIAAEEAVYAQSQTIKNMKDNYLSFERDMNIHKQKVDDLKKQLDDIISKLDRISQIEKYWNKTILNLELKQIELLSSFSDMQTPYIKGDEAEVAFIANCYQEDNGYRYSYFSGKDLDESLDNKNPDKE